MRVFVVLTVVLGAVFAGLCPGGKWTCAPSMTCCELPSGQQGCCPYANASCCPDRVHCCPTGWVCDSSGVGHCRQADVGFSRPTAGGASRPESSNYASIAKSTPREKVCCISAGNKVDCVPMVERGPGIPDLCPGNLMCCRDGIFYLGLSNYTGVPKKFFSAWMINSELVSIIDLGVGGSTECPQGNVGCPLNGKGGEMQNLAAFISVSKGKMPGMAATAQDNEVCPGGSAQCPPGNTCCPISGGQWGCCPMENAVCCSDKEHCCPSGYHCLAAGGGCAVN